MEDSFDGIKCIDCGLTFPLEMINRDIEDKGIFAKEELESILNAFEENKLRKFRDLFDENHKE